MIQLHPVAIVKNSRTSPIDDYWEAIISDIELEDGIPLAAFDNISQFSHLEIIYYFDKADKEKIVFSGHPRGNAIILPWEFSRKEKRTAPILLAFVLLNCYPIPTASLL